MAVSRDHGAAAATARFFSDMGWAPQLQQASLQDVHDAQDRSGLTSDTGHSRASTASSPGPATTWEHRRTSSEHVNGQVSMQNSYQHHASMASAGPSSASSSAFASSSRFYPNNQMVGLATGTGLDLLGVPEMEDEEEADDNDDETDSKVEDTDTQRQSASADHEGTSVYNGLRSQSEAVKRKAGGRPRDFIWRYYEDHFIDGKRAATCKFCSNRQEMPKAFRMRQHISNCKNAPADAKVMVRQEQERKDEDARLKKLAQSRKKTHSSKVGGTSSFHALLHSDETPAAPQQNIAFNPYGGLSGTLPDKPLAGGHGAKDKAPESEDDRPEASTSKRKAPASSARKRKKAKKEDTLSHFLNDPLMAPQPPAARSPVTCHVLDSTAGKPGSKVRIRLDQLGQTGFVHVANGETDSDGRNGSLLTPGTAMAKNSIFKLTFYTKDYWTAKGVESFYPFVEVVFEIKEPSEHHHIALMLSPFAYTTYRGS